MSSQRAVQGTVTGRVQGVAFRASFRRQAGALDLVGWVRNQPDGSVAFLLQGADDDVRAMLDWAASGPRLARVDAIAFEEVPLEASRRTFEIRS